MNVTRQDFGAMADGTPVHLYTLTNDSGMEARITNYGGILVSLTVPDRNGEAGDVALGYDTLAEYLGESPYFGCIVGRYGNRIGAGRFTLNGKTYALAQNDGDNHLHGGVKGFDKAVWDAKEIRKDDRVGLALSYTSPDGEEGYPGTLCVNVVYLLTNDQALKIAYSATTDQDTVVNLTHHGYFNLACGGNVLGHEMAIDADRFTPISDALIPTGELRSVAGTPLDFRQATEIGARIGEDDEQLRFGNGYDHNWVLNHGGGWLARAAQVYEPGSGRAMDVYTTEPGIQFYTGNFLDGSLTGKGGTVYHQRTGFCLETQRFPDSPNQPGFPSCVLRPGDTYQHTTVFKFYTK